MQQKWKVKRTAHVSARSRLLNLTRLLLPDGSTKEDLVAVKIESQFRTTRPELLVAEVEQVLRDQAWVTLRRQARFTADDRALLGMGMSP